MNDQKSNHRIEEDLKYIHESVDPQDNRLTSPPNGEVVRLPSVWVFEAFPPSFISNLHSSAEKMGWTRDDTLMNRNFIDTLEHIRSRFDGMGWINLGYIQKDSTAPFNRSSKAELPDGVNYIRASLVNFISSTSILALQFVLEDDLANSVQQPLKEYHSTYIEKIERGWRFHNVESQKKVAVNTFRNSIRAVCTEWTKNSFPGLFASGLLDDPNPTCEVITFKEGRPYEKVEKEQHKSYLALLGLHINFYGWKSDDIPGLFLQLPDTRDSGSDSLVLAGKIDELLTDKQLEGYWGDSRESKILSWMGYLDSTLCIWALYRAAKGFEKKLVRIRDSYSLINVDDIKQAAASINSLDKEYLDLQRNLMPISEELLSFCDNKNTFMHDVYEFKPLEGRPVRNTPELFDAIRLDLLILAKQLQKNGEIIQSLARRTAQIVNTISNSILAEINTRLQRGVYWMTAMLIILTFVLVLVETHDYIGKFIDNMITQEQPSSSNPCSPEEKGN